MKHILALFLVVLLVSCNQGKQPVLGDTAWQREQNANFKDASKSPLTDKDRKNFKGLAFFKMDSAYVVQARLTRTPDTPWFKMKTTTERLSEERVYGTIEFKLHGEIYKLNVYQGKEMMAKPGYEDYLFLPFLDDTNGETTYGGGRYLDLRIPENDVITVDFNKAYNPLCAYNEAYSCPIVPRANYVSTEVKAGVKAYKK